MSALRIEDIEMASQLAIDNFGHAETVLTNHTVQAALEELQTAILAPNMAVGIPITFDNADIRYADSVSSSAINFQSQARLGVIDEIDNLKDQIQMLKDEIENLKMLLLEN